MKTGPDKAIIDYERLLGLAVRAITAQQRGTTMSYYGTWINVQRQEERGMEVADFWIALEEVGLDHAELAAHASVIAEGVTR